MPDELVIDKDVQEARERVAEWFDRPDTKAKPLRDIHPRRGVEVNRNVWGDETGWMEPWLQRPEFADGLREFCRKCGSATAQLHRDGKRFERNGRRSRETRTVCPQKSFWNGHHDSGWMGLIWVGTA